MCITAFPVATALCRRAFPEAMPPGAPTKRGDYSRVEFERAERIGIEPTSARRMPNQQRF